MAQFLSGMTIRIGSQPSDLTSVNPAIDDPRPMVVWSVPADFTQLRYSVKISNVELLTGYALVTSGTRFGSDTLFQVPPGQDMRAEFNGLCTAQVAVSANPTGDFEFVSPVLYFVFNRTVPRFYDVNDVAIQWHRPDDQDVTPSPSTWKYELQIATDPQFNSILYDDSTDILIPDSDPYVYADHDIDTDQTTPFYPPAPTSSSRMFRWDGTRIGSITAWSTNVAYFYRVRAWDGLDWGAWSLTSAFFLFNNKPPTFRFISAAAIGNEYGDVNIIFEADDQDSIFISAELSFQGGPNDGDPLPLFLVDNSIQFQPGVWLVVWRSGRQLSRSINDVILFGRSLDGTSASPTDRLEVMIDNRNLPNPDGGLGTTLYTFPITGGITTQFNTTNLLTDLPVAGNIYPENVQPNITLLPVALGKYVWWQGYIVGPCETEPIGGNNHHGYGHDSNFADYRVTRDKSIHSLYWPEPMAQFNVYGGPTWSNAYDLDTTYMRSIMVSAAGFIFYSPFDTTTPSTLPSPYSSREMSLNRYLTGYRDLSGNIVNYPNEYDWVNRPAWHIGREVWGNDDAWIQVAYFKYTNYKACVTCQGRGFVGAGTAPPYYRIACPNPNCVNGGDHTTPWTKTRGNSSVPATYEVWKILKTFVDIKWYRLSSFMQPGIPFGSNRRLGYGVSGHKNPIGTQYVVGRQVSSLDSNSQNPLVAPTEYDPEIKGQIRKLPSSQSITWIPDTPATITRIKRQDGGVDITGNINTSFTVSTETDVLNVFPIAGGKFETTTSMMFEDPVQGHISIGIGDFTAGGVDPNSNLLHAARPAPTQPGTIAVTGNLERSWLTENLSFRFLPAWWDAYNTLHIGQTASSTSKFHIQYTTFEDDNSLGVWQDVKGDNSVYDPVFQAWLVDSLTFFEYWDTSDQIQFPDGQGYRLRVRTYDPVALEVSGWVYSPKIVILRGVANPVSMLSMVYEPWTRHVTITFRLDDTQEDHYNLLRFWYSADDGYTWVEIARGDIYGQITDLPSGDGGVPIDHQIVWDTSPYDLLAGDNYRLQIEAIPTNIENSAQLPFFRWLTPQNPNIDEAESTVQNIMGRMETLAYDPVQLIWVERPQPVWNPGQLYYDQVAVERVRTDPTDAAPSGIYSFITPNADVPNPVPSGSIYDITGVILPASVPGYNSWLTGVYYTGETHAQAMERINTEIDSFINVVVPQAKTTIINGEISIRKGMINQGYYAEEYFQGALPSGIVEQIYAPVISTADGSDGGSQILRQWAFRVQDAALGGTGLIDSVTGQYNSGGVVTGFEDVYYKLQIDPFPTYDSQQYSKPLREFLYDYNGARISAATFYGGRGIRDFIPNAALDPNIDAASNQTYPTQIVGGTMKIAPADLPGQHTADVLPSGSSSWNGPYYWRVGAYNIVDGPNKSVGRPIINQITATTRMQLMTVDFQMAGNSTIQNAAVNTAIISGSPAVTGVQVSNSFLTTPTWAYPTQLNYVSDRRAPLSAATSSSTLPWIPKGLNRPHPSMIWDDTKQMYLIYTSKLTYDGVSWRPINARAMSIPDVCEYDNYFTSDGSLAIYRPYILKALGQYWMFVTVQPAGGSSAYIGVSTSTDAETWENIQPIAFASSGIDPSVYFDGSTFHLWYEVMSSGLVKIAYATSTDGYSFDMENSGFPVYGESTNVTCPTVTNLNQNWVMYFNDNAGNIVSVFSTDGINWSGRQVELQPGTFQFAGDNNPSSVTPCNPFIYLDNFGGNQELFMLFNYRKTDGTNIVMRTMLENRIWQNGIPNKVISTGDPLTAVSCSRTGIAQRFAIDMNAHGLLPTDSIKVRLFMDTVSPATLEYYRQSDWVEWDELPDDQSYMSPASNWSFNTALIAIPYLSIASS